MMVGKGYNQTRTQEEGSDPITTFSHIQRTYLIGLGYLTGKQNGGSLMQ